MMCKEMKVIIILIILLFIDFQVDDPDVLPYYPFRDDALLYYNIIKDYVFNYVKIYYGKLYLLPYFQYKF